MRSKAYDHLKYVALVVLPAISAVYFGLGQVWDLPYVTEVIGSIAVIDGVLGTVLDKSSKNFLERATVIEAVVGQDEHGAAEIRGLEQISEAPLIFEDGQRLMMRVRHDRTPPPQG